MAEMMNPALEGATLLFPQGSFITAYAYTGVEDEIKAYQTSAWIGTALMTSPIYDVYGPDAVKLMGQVCTNDFTTLGMNGIRHAVMCNEKGQILTDGVVIRIGEDRYRTYWLDPVISYYVNTSDLDVHGENMSGKEYFIQIDGEKSLEILENAFQANLHDIMKFTEIWRIMRRSIIWYGRQVKSWEQESLGSRLITCLTIRRPDSRISIFTIRFRGWKPARK